MKMHLTKNRLNSPFLFLILLFLLSSCASNYKRIETSFNSNDLKISARIYKPSVPGKYPAVVIVHGSEPDTKDHYSEYSKAFSQNGIVALTYDKRGVGESEGNLWKSSMDDLANDAVAALNFLKQFEFVDSTRIGLWGISQGGWVITKAGMKSDGVKFLVCVSAPAMSPAIQNEYYINKRVLRNGGTKEYAQKLSRALNSYMESLKDTFDLRVLNSLIHSVKNHPLSYTAKSTSFLDFLPDTVYPDLNTETVLMNPAGRNYFYNPVPDWLRLNIPMLMFYGGKDDIVPGKKCYPEVTALNKRNILTYFYPDADHGLREKFLFGNKFPGGYIEKQIDWIKNIRNNEN